MSSTLRIRELEGYKSVWMPQSGTFEMALVIVIKEVKVLSEPLAMTLGELIIPGYYADFNSLTPEQFLILLKATEKAFEDILQILVYSEISKHDDIPSLFPFSQLKALFRVDDRISGIKSQDYSIIINNNLSWTVAAWVYDLILEALAIHLHPVNQNLVRLLVKSRSNYNKICDLRLISSDDYCLLLKLLTWLAEYFEPCERGRIAFSPNFNSVLCLKIPELLTIFIQDSRAINCDKN